MRDKDKKYHLDLTGIEPTETGSGRVWNFGGYKGKSSMAYFEFVGFADHVHIGRTETYYILGGRGKFSVHSVIPSDGRIPGFLLAEKIYDKKVSEGSIVHINKGEAHSLIVPSGLTLDVLLIMEPEYNKKDLFWIKK